MTYSIVARDAETGQLGVAVQTCMFAVGSIVPWARAGVGAVATQAIAEPAYGPWCLDALASGASAADALAAAQSSDPLSVIRQVGVVGADGTAAAATGDLCIDYAGHLVGDGFAVQANMMSTADVWPAMAAAFSASAGPLAHRLLAALVAGEAAGGDARGRMAAALVVVDGALPAQPGAGTVVDVRVDRSDDPLGDLAQLLVAADAFRAFNRSVDQLVGGDAQGALTAVDGALELLPDETNMRFLRAGALAGTGKTDAAAAELRALVGERPTWEVVVRSMAAKGLIAFPADLSIDDALA